MAQADQAELISRSWYETLKQGYDADLVASGGGVAAAAAFTGFNLSENGRRQASNVELEQTAV